MRRDGGVAALRGFRGLVVVVLGMMLVNHALAAKPRVPTVMELRTLPPYCGPRIGELTFAHYPAEMVAANAPAAKMWKERFGAVNYSHLHHYCFALNYMNRARFEPNKNDKELYLKMALLNFDYVLKRWRPDFQLYGSAKVYRSQVETQRSLSSGR